MFETQPLQAASSASDRGHADGAQGKPPHARPGKAVRLWHAEPPERAPPSPHPDQSSPAGTTDKTQNRAAARITRTMRAHSAKEAYSDMVRDGQMWKVCRDLLVASGKLKPDENLNLAKLSSLNISTLRRELGTLTESEGRFFDRFTHQKFFATHFTNADLDTSSPREGVLAMHSRRILQQRNIPFHEGHTASIDSYWKGDDSFVFFSLECGEQPKKLDSRFGGRLYRVPFDSPAFIQSSWGALDDLLGQTKNPQRLLPRVSTGEANAFKEACCRTERRDFEHDLRAYSDIFIGKDLIAATALSIILQLRKLQLCLPLQESPTLSERLLASSTPEDINGLLNGIYRPEIRVPSRFISNDYQSYSPKEISRMKAERGTGIILGNAGKGQILTQGHYLWLKTKDGAIHELDVRSLLDELTPKALLSHLAEAEATGAKRAPALQFFFQHVLKLFQEPEDPRDSFQKWLSDFAHITEEYPPEARDPIAPAIMVAASLGLTPALHDLLEAGGDVNASAEDGTTALMLAAMGNHLETLHFLIRNGANKDAKDEYGDTPLMFALSSGELPALTALLNAGARTEEKNDRGETPLMRASIRSDIQALTVLLHAGANPDATDAEGSTALALAALHGSIEAARVFIDHGSDGVKELIATARRGDDEAAAVLLRAGADGVRALLHLAPRHMPELRRLIQAGADRVRDALGRTALMRAVEMTAGFPRVRLQGLRALRALLDAGADTEITDGGGKTARMQAAELAHSKGDDAALLAFQQARA